MSSTTSRRHVRILSAPKVIFEAKIVGERGAVFAIREAVGQLHEYSYFLHRQTAGLCILLDEAPGEPLTEYVESRLRMLIAWVADEQLSCGPKTRQRLAWLMQRPSNIGAALT